MLKSPAPYLKKGRRYDYYHTRIVLPLGEEIARRDELDASIVIPGVIFHDIGWSQVSEDLRKNYRTGKARRAHMREGAKLTQKLLAKLHYSPAKIKRIAWIVSVHDNQSAGIGKNLEDPEALAVASIDFLWRATPQGFRKDLRELGISPSEQIKKLRQKAKDRGLPAYPTLYRIFLRLARERAQEFRRRDKR